MNAHTTLAPSARDNAMFAATLAERAAAYDWPATEAARDERGWAPLVGALTPEECDALTSLYPREEYFRSRVVMGRHGFGSGEYHYFRYSLPALVAYLRVSL